MSLDRFTKSSDEGVGNVVFFNATKLFKEGNTDAAVEGVFDSYAEREVTITVKGKQKTILERKYKLTSEDGEQTIYVDVAGNLKYSMDKMDVQPGDLCRIEYKGKNEKDYHTFVVRVAK